MKLYLVRAMLPGVLLWDCPWGLVKARSTEQALQVFQARLMKHQPELVDPATVDVVTALPLSNIKGTVSCHALYR